jgi:hypothetical protein
MHGVYVNLKEAEACNQYTKQENRKWRISYQSNAQKINAERKGIERVANTVRASLVIEAGICTRGRKLRDACAT